MAKARGYCWLAAGALALIAFVGSPYSAQDAQTTGAERSVEFEIADRLPTLSGFVIGYFVPGTEEPAFTFTVDRRSVQSPSEGVVRLPLIQGVLPAGQTFVVRLRTVAGGNQSEWSAPSAPFTVTEAEARWTPPETTRAAEPRPGRERRARTGRSAAADLERDPALRERISALFPGQAWKDHAAGFRNVQELVTALYLAKNLSVSFDDVAQLATDAGRVPLRQVVTQLKPDADPSAELRQARRQARKALAGRKP